MEITSYVQDHSEKRYDKFEFNIKDAQPSKGAMNMEEFFKKFFEDKDQIIMEVKKEYASFGKKPENLEYVPSQTTIFLDNARTPISYSKTLAQEFEHPPYLSSYLRASHVGFTFWGESVRAPQFNQKERLICML
jgi:hypothetical protein